MLKAKHYIKNFDIFTDKNYGKNGLFSIEGFILIIISAHLLGENKQFIDLIAALMQKDPKLIAERTIIIGSVCFTMMFFIYIANIFVTKDKNYAINNFSWSIIVIFLSSVISFIMSLFDGYMKNIILYEKDFVFVVLPIFVMSIIIISAKILNFPDTGFVSIIRINIQNISAIIVTSVIFLGIFSYLITH